MKEANKDFINFVAHHMIEISLDSENNIKNLPLSEMKNEKKHSEICIPTTNLKTHITL